MTRTAKLAGTRDIVPRTVTFPDTVMYCKDSYTSQHYSYCKKATFPDTPGTVTQTATLLDFPCVVIRTTVLCEDYFLTFICSPLRDTVGLRRKER